MFIKLASLALTGLIGMGASTISSDGNSMGQYNAPPVAIETPAVAPVVVVAPAQIGEQSFPRGFTSKQGQPCDDQRGGVDYSSEIVSREEMIYELTRVGFTGDRLTQMLGISLAEGGRQTNCIADENLTTSKWDYSVGIYSIRTLKADYGTGSCRDLARLKGNVREQTICAWEISGQGKSLQPWSTFTNGKWRSYVNR